ncbi:MAG: hypothetical protein ACTSWC_09440 [Promethearchaeota archaeon]
MEKFHQQQDQGIFSQNYHKIRTYSKKQGKSRKKWPIFFLEWCKSRNYPYKIESHRFFPRTRFWFILFPILWLMAALAVIIGILSSTWILIYLGLGLLFFLLVSDYGFQIWDRCSIHSHKPINGQTFRIQYPSKKKKDFDMNMAKIVVFSHFDFPTPSYQNQTHLFIHKFYPLLTVLTVLSIFIHIILKIFTENLNQEFVILFRMLILFFSVLLIFSQIILIIFQKNGKITKDIAENEEEFKLTLFSSLIDYFSALPSSFQWCDMEFIFLSGYEDIQIKNHLVFKNFLIDCKEYQEIFPIYLDFGPSPPFLYMLSKKKLFHRNLSSSSHINLPNLLKHFLTHYRIIPISQINQILPRFSFLHRNFVTFTNQSGRYRWVSQRISEAYIIKFGEKFSHMLLDLFQILEQEIEDIFTPEFQK